MNFSCKYPYLNILLMLLLVVGCILMFLAKYIETLSNPISMIMIANFELKLWLWLQKQDEGRELAICHNHYHHFGLFLAIMIKNKANSLHLFIYLLWSLFYFFIFFGDLNHSHSKWAFKILIMSVITVYILNPWSCSQFSLTRQILNITYYKYPFYSF